MKKLTIMLEDELVTALSRPVIPVASKSSFLSATLIN
jgi:hypothetical protein